MLLRDAIRQWQNHAALAGRSALTLRGARSALKQFAAFLDSEGIQEIGGLDTAVLLRYREDLSWRLTPKGTPLQINSQLSLLGHVSTFCHFLVERGWLLADPSRDLPRPRKPQRLPKAVVDLGELDHLLSLPDLQTPRGYRDRVMLEVLYSTAIRREELANLCIDEIDLEGGYVFVREGKGCKDRVVPLGRSACDWMRSYLRVIRPEWPGLKAGARADRHVFLNRWGKGMTPNAVGQVVRKYGDLAGLDKHVSTHLLRHACATHMLRNGAPIRQLQEMLGHASLETTQLYTRVTINDLRAMHARFHPRETGSEFPDDPLP